MIIFHTCGLLYGVFLTSQLLQPDVLSDVFCKTLEVGNLTSHCIAALMICPMFYLVAIRKVLFIYLHTLGVIVR